MSTPVTVEPIAPAQWRSLHPSSGLPSTEAYGRARARGRSRRAALQAFVAAAYACGRAPATTDGRCSRCGRFIASNR